MPNVTLIPYPVTPRRFPETAWWLHATTTRVLVSEYLKYLPAMARLAAAQLLGQPVPPDILATGLDLAALDPGRFRR